MSKNYFLLSAQQWIGTFLLLGAVAALVLFIYLIPQPSLSPLAQNDTLVTPPASYTHYSSYPDHPSSNRHTAYTPIHYSYFDPNRADSVTLLKQGLKPWQAHNLIKYRKAGGSFRKPEDMRRLYGLAESQYQAMRPYIRIPHSRQTPHDAKRDTTRRDTFPRYVSHKRDTVLELNTADTSQLQMLRGIGRWTAVQIVRYREQLGGYYAAEQLREIPHIDQQMLDTVLKRFTVNTQYITLLPVNRISVTRLQRHPYLRFEQARDIYELRRNRITLHSIDDLHSLPSLSDEDINRLNHYLSFE